MIFKGSGIMKFGERMKRVREEKNLTLEEMARVIGVTKARR